MTVVALLALLAAASHGQVVTRQAAPGQESCPLQLDFDLSKPATRSALVDGEEGVTVSSSTAAFVCDKARVENIAVRKEKERGRQVLLLVTALLSTDWVRQGVNLTVQFLANGEVKREEQFQALTIGTTEGAAGYLPGGSSSKERGGRWWVKRSDFESWFAPDSKPAVRVILETVPQEGGQ